MNTLRKIGSNPIMDESHVQKRDDKTNYRTQTEVCGFGARTPRSINRIYSRVCKSKTWEHDSSFTPKRDSKCQNLKPIKSKRVSSRNGNNFNSCRNNTKTINSIDLILDNSIEFIDIRTSDNLGGVA